MSETTTDERAAPTMQEVQYIAGLLDGGVRSGKYLDLSYQHAVVLLDRISILTAELERIADCEPVHKERIRAVLNGGGE